ncbi:hypothetical protein ACFYP6_33705 [Streptomyces goshikiensis]|uniref:hypothetical protein n=1 Tax=Streptomyces goshikiensis TaxID=1942 RepID=UPI0036ADFBBD
MPADTVFSQKKGEVVEEDFNVVDRVLLEAARVRPHPAYINADSYGDWYINAHTGLLKALAALAAQRNKPSLTSQLEQMAGHMCLEVLTSGFVHELRERL